MTVTPETDRSTVWAKRIRQLGDQLGGSRGLFVEGKLTRMVGLTLEAIGCRAAIGGRCDVINAAGARIEAEVVGFSGESLYLMPTGDLRGLEPDARVVPTGRISEAIVGDELLGRIIDGSGNPLDNKGFQGGFGLIQTRLVGTNIGTGKLLCQGALQRLQVPEVRPLY